MTDILSFQKVNINKMPGIESPGLSIDNFEPGINIVYGPNAAGKTTLARASSYLLWPELQLPDRVDISGRFTINDENWYVEVDSVAGRYNYQKEGSPSPGPPLPPAGYRDRYLIALHDLLQKDTDDSNLAREIIRESMGGYQIAAAAEELGFEEKQLRSTSTTRRARKKIQEYRELRRKQQELEAEENKLDYLYQEKEEIKKASTRLEVVRQVLQYYEQKEEYDKLQGKLHLFPDNMSKIAGNETEILAELKEDKKEYQRKNEKAGEQYREAERILEEVDLPEGGVKTGRLKELKNRKEELKSREERLATLDDDLQEAKCKRNEERENFIDLIEEEELSRLDGATYNQLNDFARRAEEVNNRFFVLESLKKRLNPEEEIPVSEGKLKRGIELLADWLQIKEQKGKTDLKMKRISLLSAGFIAILAVITGLIISPYFFLTLILAGGIAWYGFQDETDITKEDIEQEFQSLDLSLPREWEHSLIKVHRQELQEMLAEVKLLKKRKQYWQDREPEHEQLEEKKKKIERERQQLIARYGVAPGTDEQTLYHFTNRLSRWQDAHSRVLAIKEKLENNEQAYQELRSELNRILGEYGYNQANGAAKIGADINDLEERNNRYQQAIKDKRTAAEIQEEMTDKIQQVEKEWEKLFRQAGLQPGEEDELAELCRRYDDYKQLQDELKSAEALSQHERKQLEKSSNYDPSYLQLEKIELQEMKRELSARADELDSVSDRIRDIEIKIKNAREGSRMENALAARERSLAELEDELYDDYQKRAGSVLTEYIREITNIENRPEVFERAGEILVQITRGRYRLELGDIDSPSFRAIDTRTGRGKDLSELSSGTRIQLLLAVRMAFVDREEEGLMLPLYLDETLANADDSKARAIISSIIELARRGRQCFYFTARKEEVQKWFALLEQEEVNINLVELKGQEERDETIVLPAAGEMIPEIDNIPRAGNRSHQEYGEELTIPPLNLRQGAGSVHLWYLIDDTELLEHLLKSGIENWGQLKTLLAGGNYDFVPVSKRGELQIVKQLGRCLEEFVDSWQVGRGKPVDRAVLVDSGAVSENFIDQVTELAAEVDGKGELIIEKLRAGEVKRFYHNKIEQLEEYLREQEYITETDPLTPDQLRLRMLGVLDADKLENPGEQVRTLLNRLYN